MIGGMGLVLIMASAGSSWAQEITSVRTLQGKVDVGNLVELQIDFSLPEGRNPFCGLEISYGDGNVDKLRPGLDGAKDFPFKLNHKYEKPGSYSVRVEGKFVSRGLKSAGACSGDAKTTMITVVDPVAERTKEENQRQADDLDRKARELAAQEARLRQLSDELERNKKSQQSRTATRDSEPPAQPSKTTPTQPLKATPPAPKSGSIDPF